MLFLKAQKGHTWLDSLWINFCNGLSFCNVSGSLSHHSHHCHHRSHHSHQPQRTPDHNHLSTDHLYLSQLINIPISLHSLYFLIVRSTVCIAVYPDSLPPKSLRFLTPLTRQRSTAPLENLRETTAYHYQLRDTTIITFLVYSHDFHPLTSATVSPSVNLLTYLWVLSLHADRRPDLHLYHQSDVDTRHQCWGKLLLKVMHYNIALLPKKSN